MIKQGEFYSEISHYQIDSVNGGSVSCKHMASKESVSIGRGYIDQYCKSASDFEETIKVGYNDKYWTQKQVLDWIKENDLTETSNIEGWSIEDWFVILNEAPRVGDVKLKGIKSIFRDIRDATAFTIVFKKVDKKKTKKSHEAEIEARSEEYAAKVEKARNGKKSMLDASKEVIMDLINNPILDYTPGEVRTMICYKEQFESRDGHYKVFDLEAGETRLINLKTTQEIIVNNKKYVLE